MQTYSKLTILKGFFHKKIDFLQVEGLSDLIASETEAQRRLALRLSSGEFSHCCEMWRQKFPEIMNKAEVKQGVKSHLVKKIGNLRVVCDFSHFVAFRILKFRCVYPNTCVKESLYGVV